jgi:hypothetical protein
MPARFPVARWRRGEANRSRASLRSGSGASFGVRADGHLQAGRLDRRAQCGMYGSASQRRTRARRQECNRARCGAPRHSLISSLVLFHRAADSLCAPSKGQLRSGCRRKPKPRCCRQRSHSSRAHYPCCNTIQHKRGKRERRELVYQPHQWRDWSLEQRASIDRAGALRSSRQPRVLGCAGESSRTGVEWRRLRDIRERAIPIQRGLLRHTGERRPVVCRWRQASVRFA